MAGDGPGGVAGCGDRADGVTCGPGEGPLQPVLGDDHDRGGFWSRLAADVQRWLAQPFPDLGQQARVAVEDAGEVFQMVAGVPARYGSSLI
jgi:hypothetical protein